MFGYLVVSSLGPRAMFSECLSDLGLGLGGLYLENIDLDSSDNCFTLIGCFAMLFLLSVSGGYHCRKRWSGMVGFLFRLSFMLFWDV